MRFVVKILISLCVIIACTQIARWRPTLAGLIAVMPLTGVLVLVWVYLETGGEPGRMVGYCRGALFGIAPTILFFVTALLCFRRQMSLWVVLGAGFAVWFVAALVHQWLLGK